MAKTLKELLAEGSAVAQPVKPPAATTPTTGAPPRAARPSLRELAAAGDVVVLPVNGPLPALPPSAAARRANAALIGAEAGATAMSRDEVAGFAGAMGGSVGRAVDAVRDAWETGDASHLVNHAAVDALKQAGRGDFRGALKTAFRGGSPLAQTVGDYREGRDLARAEEAKAAAEEPWAYYPGTIAGGMLIPGGQSGRAATYAGRARAALESGVALGGLGGINASGADFTEGEGGRAALGAGAGMALGAAAGIGGQFVGERALPFALRGAQRGLERLGVATGRRVLLHGADSLTKRTTSDDAVREALRVGGILPWGTTQGAAQRMAARADDLGAQYGSIVDGLEAAGVQGPEVAPLADNLRWTAVDRYFNTGSNKNIANAFMDEADNAVALAQGGERLGLRQAENLKQNLQAQAQHGLTEETLLNEARREVASAVRQANEDAVEAAGRAAPPDSEVALLAESFVPIKQRLGRTIEARNAATRGGQKADNRGGGVGVADVTAMAAAGDMGTGLLAAMARRVLNNRLPSTIATGSYWSSQVARALANQSPRGTARVVTAAERELLADYLQSQEAQAAALRNRKP